MTVHRINGEAISFRQEQIWGFKDSHGWKIVNAIDKDEAARKLANDEVLPATKYRNLISKAEFGGAK